MIIEFKTGQQNSDFRRASAQLIDYGSDLWRLTYEEFERTVVARCFAAETTKSDALLFNWSELDVTPSFPVRLLNPTLGRPIFFLRYSSCLINGFNSKWVATRSGVICRRKRLTRSNYRLIVRSTACWCTRYLEGIEELANGDLPPLRNHPRCSTSVSFVIFQ